MNLSLIAIYRYLSIVRPFSKIYALYKKQFLITSEILIWMICFGASLPDLLYLETQQTSRKICGYDQITSSFSTLLILFSIFYYVIPSAIIVIFCWKIVIHQRNYVRPGQSPISRQLDATKKDKRIKSIMIISASYVLTTWPLFAVYVGQAISRKTLIQVLAENRVNYWLSMLSISTATIISALNPFLYFNLDENVRRSFKNRVLKRSAIVISRT